METLIDTLLQFVLQEYWEKSAVATISRHGENFSAENEETMKNINFSKTPPKRKVLTEILVD